MKQPLLLYSKTHIWNTGSESSICLTYRIRERMFQGAKVPGIESSRERKYQGAKVPPMVLSLLGAKVRGNESSSYQSQQTKLSHSACLATRIPPKRKMNMTTELPNGVEHPSSNRRCDNCLTCATALSHCFGPLQLISIMYGHRL